MSSTDTCLICGRTGHTSSSCPAEAKRRREQQRGAARAAVLAVVAMVSAAAGYGAGRVVDGVCAAVDRALQHLHITPAPAPGPVARHWVATVRPWALGRPVTWSIPASEYQTARTLAEIAYPHAASIAITLQE